METMTTPIELLLNDVFQVIGSGKIFQIAFKNSEKVQFINIDEYENYDKGAKLNRITVTAKQFQKAYEGGQFKIISTNLTRSK